MAMKSIILFFMAISASMADARSISEVEYVKMKRQLRSLNKPAVKTIKLSKDDIFDCVEIYKQPAFDHPLLKNHTVEMPPSFTPKGLSTVAESDGSDAFGLPDGGCPEGTVPIRRAKMEDLLIARTLSSSRKNYSIKDQSSKSGGAGIHHVAKVSTKPGDYYGTYAEINIWSLNVVGSKRYSSAQFWLKSGPESEVNTIEVGWMINEDLFKDNEPRFFAYWTADGHNNTGCFNTLCPGFVIVNRRIPLGSFLLPASQTNGTQYSNKFNVYQSGQSWFLYWNDTAIGYWPKTLFNHMAEKAEIVEWGGEVLGQSDNDMPQMGSGEWPDTGFGYACYMKNLQVDNEKRELVDAPEDTTIFSDAPKCYAAKDMGTRGENWYRTIYFGGPGVDCT